MSDKQLMPCPFCGGTNLVIESETEALTGGEPKENDFVSVLCDFRQGGCGASGGFRATEEDAVTAWNRRR